MKFRFLFGAVALAAMLAVSACGQDGATDQMPVEQEATAVMDATAPEATDAPLQIVDVTPDAEAEGEAVPAEGVELTPATEGEAAATPAAEGSSDAALTATAQLQNAAGEPVGTATFTEMQDSTVMISAQLTGLETDIVGPHGIHIHQTGACTPDFDAAGGHFNPTGMQHGLDNPAGPHMGDLPNIQLDEAGNGAYEATTDLFTLSDGDRSLFDDDGSALVIHAEADDQVTDPSGNSGDRIACGVIVASAE
ncbi:MAG: superoxide dismutase family protein [Caldilinea sp.]